MTRRSTLPLLVIALAIALFSQTVTAKVLFTGRKYYVAGEFTKAIQEDESTLDSKNLAVFNGEEWELPGGLEPNGRVRKVFKDICQNLWIAGEFSMVGQTKTGPLAVMFSGTNAFEPVGNGDQWNDGAEVRDLHVDCWNIPKGGICTKKQCDVYVAGKFTKAGTGVQTTNVAWWEAESNTWSALDGLPDGKVNAIRYFSNDKEVYVGGEFEGYAKKTERDEVAWVPLNTAQAFDGVVYTMYSDPDIPPFNNNHLYLGGKFNKPHGKIVRYLTKNSEFEILAKEDTAISGSVRAIGLSDDYVYIGGDFSTKSTEYVAKAKKDDDTYWRQPSGAPVPVDSLIRAMFVCTSNEANCKDGDAFVAGDNKRKSIVDLLPIEEAYSGNGYFEEKGGAWTQFGYGVNGDIYGMNTAFSSAHSALRSCSLYLYGLVSLVVLAILL